MRGDAISALEVVDAGPGGLGTAVYGASEGLDKRLRCAPPPGQAKDGDWPLATRVQAYTAFALGIAALLVAIATPLLYIGTWTMGTAGIVLAKVAERGYADLSTWTRWAACTALLLDLCAAAARLFLI